MDPLTIWILALATLWLLKMIAEQLWWVATGRVGESPASARRREREQRARDAGTSTVGQAVSARLVYRIEHPPDRRWARELRGLLAEMWSDSVQEARIGHQSAHAARVRRRQQRARNGGWRVRTGGQRETPRPPQPEPGATPEPAAIDTLDTRPCAECGEALVVSPDELCEDCEAALGPPPVPDSGPDTEPMPVIDADDTPEHDIPEQYSDRKAPPMSETHYIDGDVSDPRRALFFSLSSRALNDAMGRELGILHGNLRGKGVGDGALGQVAVLIDGAAAYSRSNQQSAVEYAQHVVIQAEIAGDPDLEGTVRRTYLDTHGGDTRSVPRQGGKSTINAADCHDPASAARIMTAIAQVYRQMQVRVDAALGQHSRDDVGDAAARFLAAQIEHAARIADLAEKAAERFRRHTGKRNDTVGRNRSVAGTQRGGYLDPAKV